MFGGLKFSVEAASFPAMFAKASRSERHAFLTRLSSPQAITTALEEEAAERV